jgi:hypothetical protein
LVPVHAHPPHPHPHPCHQYVGPGDVLLPPSSRVWDGDMVAAALGSLVPDRSLVYRVSRVFEGSDAVSRTEPVYGTHHTPRPHTPCPRKHLRVGMRLTLRLLKVAESGRAELAECDISVRGADVGVRSWPNGAAWCIVFDSWSVRWWLIACWAGTEFGVSPMDPTKLSDWRDSSSGWSRFALPPVNTFRPDDLRVLPLLNGKLGNHFLDAAGGVFTSVYCGCAVCVTATSAHATLTELRDAPLLSRQLQLWWMQDRVLSATSGPLCIGLSSCFFWHPMAGVLNMPHSSLPVVIGACRCFASPRLRLLWRLMSPCVVNQPPTPFSATSMRPWFALRFQTMLTLLARRVTATSFVRQEYLDLKS